MKRPFTPLFEGSGPVLRFVRAPGGGVGPRRRSPFRRATPWSLALLIGAAFLASPAAAQQEGGKRFNGWQGAKPQVDCTCRRPGGGPRAQLGEVICLKRNGRFVQARCELPQNNPFWNILEQECEQPLS